MNSFLVLGEIPGTNFQIDFSTWLNIAGVLLAIIILSIALRSRRAHRTISALQNIVIDQQSADRKQLHASQLHQRAQ